MSHLLDKVHSAFHDAKSNAHDLAKVTKSLAEEKMLDIPYVDLKIQFIGASGIPKMDLSGSADPYFVAKLDNRISYVSNVREKTMTPVWNEIWKVKNVPTTADLYVELLDKDAGQLHDDFIGKFKTSVAAGSKEAEIEGPVFSRQRGTFWLKIESTPSTNPKEHPFLFDGPVRWTRHFSPTVGRLTNINTARLYSTWKMYLIGVQKFFGDKTQHWNVKYAAAQKIFGTGPTSMAVRTGIQMGHRLLYARTATNAYGTIESGNDMIEILHAGGNNLTQMVAKPDDQYANRVKPAVYTYIISAEDDSFRFSETGAAFFVDFASKHALHANCAEAVRYSGEFHPRPECGWDKFSDEIADSQVKWELVIDNNSGTYSPDKTLLPTLKGLLEHNFHGFTVVALDREDPELTKSREDCRAYALKYRGVKSDELQPHKQVEGEETLLTHALSTKK